MLTKNYSTYRILYKNGFMEEVNAENIEQAIRNKSVAEEISPVLQITLQAENIPTFVEDMPAEIPFIATVLNGGGSIATPASGTVHVGDVISLNAIPDRNYEFVSWKRNDKIISEDPLFSYTMEALEEGETTVAFTASFKLKDITFTTDVLPADAKAAGCLSYPTSMTVAANSAYQLLAVEGQGYTFSHWERNGTVLTTDKMATVTVSPLASDELSVKYNAVFILS